MIIEQEIYLKEEGFSPEKCTASLESPVSSKFVSVRINGERHEYFNLRKTSLNEIVDIMLLRTTSEKVLEELKEIVKKLEKDTQDKELLDKLKNPPQLSPFDSDLFTEKIAETANKTAQVSHDLEMKRIKAKMIADICVKLVEYPTPYGQVADIAREIADKALENI